jgi:hypothetical protein
MHRKIIRYREGAVAQLPSLEGMAFVLPSCCSAARSPLPAAAWDRRKRKEKTNDMRSSVEQREQIRRPG